MDRYIAVNLVIMQTITTESDRSKLHDAECWYNLTLIYSKNFVALPMIKDFFISG